jgi:large-conductance mechanosensitive channel
MPKTVRRIGKRVFGMSKEVFRQLLTLATSAFGLVAALAWNALIQEFVADYIKPLLGGVSGIVSLLIYAVVVTILAVVITYNLSKLAEKK